MASRFESTFRDRVIRAAERAFGVTVQFQAGVNLSEEFTARRADQIYTVTGAEYGVEIQITMRDFILPVASVVVDGDTLEPRTGNRITEGDEVFEIQPIDDKRPAVELQSGGYEWLVHTKKVE